ncbi:hypothetical protein BKA70DRAFT_1563678 [Coprinopsis sp. MPI-PUGE-AT-0042]|nr:hypothetical protein BKA70DRAFT_1563678 [Coprinopsis sp. MPI-PUGE-AT-0042]
MSDSPGQHCVDPGGENGTLKQLAPKFFCHKGVKINDSKGRKVEPVVREAQNETSHETSRSEPAGGRSLPGFCFSDTYLDKALLALGLHTEARTSVITYWLPSFNKHKNIALRFLPQEAYERAAPLNVQPKPDVVARIFMLFQGIQDADLEDWHESSQRAGEPVEAWADVVGIDKTRVLDPSSFRVIEWGGMEIHV